MARRKVKSLVKFDVESRGLVEYADDEPSAFATMLGGLIEANIRTHPEKERDFDSLVASVGVFVTDIDEGVTLDFKGGQLIVHNGLEPKRTLTIRGHAQTVMSLSNLKIGLFGLPVYYDEVGRGVAAQRRRGYLKNKRVLHNLVTLNAGARMIFT